MGSGKTSLGKRLARKLDLSFVDLDLEIVRQENRSVPEIFRDEGESGFRSIEKEILTIEKEILELRLRVSQNEFYIYKIDHEGEK